MGRIIAFASAGGMSFYDALLRARAVPSIGKAADKIAGFTDQIEDFKARLSELSIKDLIEEILEKTGYRKEIQEEGEVESETRLQNIEELINKAAAYWEGAEEPTLGGFLEEVALVAEVDNMDESENRVVLMTLHSAKGLEFRVVYILDANEGVTPHHKAVLDPDVEEERRMFYVAMTRAKERLHIYHVKERYRKKQAISRFAEEAEG